jgi:hypothetical protein
VLELVEAGLSYDDVADRLGVRPGLAYFIATGLPADGSETALTDEDQARPGYLATATQHLANPAPVHSPTHGAVVHDWISSRVRADAAMRRAASEPRAGTSSRRDPDDDRDITTVLGRDHNAVHSLTSKFKTTPGATQGGAPDQIDTRAALVTRISVALREHEPAEDEHLWPAVEALVPGGEQLASLGRAQEHEVATTLAALAALDPHDARYDELVEQLEHQIRAHVAFEDRVFLALRDVTTDEQREQLGARIRAAEIVEPTRKPNHDTA